MIRRRRRAPPWLVAGLLGASLLATEVVLAAPSASRAAAKELAEGRKHAERASHLAASGKCRQALGEYDKAIAVLHDPTLLFNRGECHRRLGDVEAALADYKQFLSDLPSAPNRAEVEARIAELQSNEAPMGSTGTTATPGAATVPPGAPGPVARPGARPSGLGTAPAPAARVGVAPPPAPEPPPAMTLTAPTEPRPVVASAAPASGSDSLASRPWFWVALGAVVVGAGLGTYFVLGRDPTNIPRSDLGNYRF